MIYKFFKAIKTIEELKKQYKKLAFEHHPDRGGNTADMQQINNEYDELLKRVKNVHATADGKTYTKTDEPVDVPDNFRQIINAIISFNCRIELCGSWLWVFNGYAYREQLKELGFFYCSNKKAWAWTDNPTNNRHKLSLETFRRTVQTISSRRTHKKNRKITMGEIKNELLNQNQRRTTNG